MRLTKRQRDDIETMLWFCPDAYKHEPTDDEIREYFAMSERGEGSKHGKFSMNPIYISLVGGYEGRRKWYNPLRLILGDYYHVPLERKIIDFMKKEVFKEIDAAVIEKCYQEVLEESVTWRLLLKKLRGELTLS